MMLPSSLMSSSSPVCQTCATSASNQAPQEGESYSTNMPAASATTSVEVLTGVEVEHVVDGLLNESLDGGPTSCAPCRCPSPSAVGRIPVAVIFVVLLLALLLQQPRISRQCLHAICHSRSRASHHLVDNARQLRMGSPMTVWMVGHQLVHHAHVRRQALLSAYLLPVSLPLLALLPQPPMISRQCLHATCHTRARAVRQCLHEIRHSRSRATCHAVRCRQCLHAIRLWSAFIILGPTFWACRDRGLLEAFLGSVLEVLILPIAYWASSDMSALFGFTAVAASTVIAFILRASCWA